MDIRFLSPTLTAETLLLNLMDTQRSTKTARMNILRIEAPLVMSCKIPPDISLVISEPAL